MIDYAPTLEVVNEYGELALKSTGEGQENFFGVPPKCPFLISHDIMEHIHPIGEGSFNEIVSIGAMIFTRIEGGYFDRVEAMRGVGPTKFLEDALVSEVEMLEDVQRDLKEGLFTASHSTDAQILEGEGVYASRIRDARVGGDILREIFKPLENGSFMEELKERNPELQKMVMGALRMGYQYAKLNYSVDPEKTAMTFKAVNKVVENFFKFGVQEEGQRVRIAFSPKKMSATLTTESHGENEQFHYHYQMIPGIGYEGTTNPKENLVKSHQESLEALNLTINRTNDPRQKKERGKALEA